MTISEFAERTLSHITAAIRPKPLADQIAQIAAWLRWTHPR